MSDLKPILRGVWQGGQTYSIDSSSGKLATEYTPEDTREEKVVSNVHSILHWVNKDDPRGPVPTNPNSDGQYRYWEYGVQAWKNTEGIRDGNESEIPNESDDVHEPGLIEITITRPLERDSIAMDETLRIAFDHKSKNNLRRADYYIDGVLIGSSTKAPFLFSFIPEEMELTAGSHVLKVVGRDSKANIGEDQVTFRVD